MTYVWMISLVAALGGLLFGYDWIVISGAKMFYEKQFHLTTAFLEGWATSCALVGCLVGSLMAGGLSDRYGRKRLADPGRPVVRRHGRGRGAGAGHGRAGRLHLVRHFPHAGGMGIGLASNISPVYIAEVSPAEVRGRLVSLEPAYDRDRRALGAVCELGDRQLRRPHGHERAGGRFARCRRRLPGGVCQGVHRQVRAADPRRGGRPSFMHEQAAVPAMRRSWRFLKDTNRIKLPASYAELAHRGLVPWNETAGWRWMFGGGHDAGAAACSWRCSSCRRARAGWSRTAGMPGPGTCWPRSAAPPLPSARWPRSRPRWSTRSRRSISASCSSRGCGTILALGVDARRAAAVVRHQRHFLLCRQGVRRPPDTSRAASSGTSW